MIDIHKVDYDITHFYFEFSSSLDFRNASISICYKNGTENDVAFSERDGVFLGRIDYKDCNIITDKIIVSVRGEKYQLPIKFDFDIEKENDIHYMNKTIFSASGRKKGNELFYFLTCILSVISTDSKFYLGLLSVLSYRIAENPIERKHIGLDVIHRRLKAINSFSHNSADPILMRWIVSSGYSVAVLCIYYKMPHEAMAIINSFIHFSRYAAINHMLYWNLASSLLIKGYLHYGNADIELAKLAFLELTDLTERGVRDIYSTRNDALVTQTADCCALIEIGAHAYVTAYVCFNGNLPLESKLIKPKYIDNYYLDFVSAVRRFDKGFPPKLSILMDIKNKLNSHLKSLINNGPQ